jgi:para-aminobenzoate synthetase/4-amino-4-deoxychorismate lyase
MLHSPHNIAAARRLVADETGAMLFETSSTHPGPHKRSLLFRNPIARLEVHTLADLPATFQAIEQALANGHWVAGFLSYECGYHWEPSVCPNYEHPSNELPLAAFGIFNEPESCTAEAQPTETEEALTELSLSLTREQYEAQFHRVQQWIAAGETYQLNLTAEVHAPNPHNPAAFFAHMMHAQPVDFGAMLNLGQHHILSASPELFFHQQGRAITVRPMKGTAPRGQTPTEDDRLASALAADTKSRAENIMIVDLLRNDLGRIAEFGSVIADKLFTIERLPSLLQMTSEVRAILRPDITPYKLFAALFPSGSIIGAPKVHSMQLLRTLEQRDRGVYTGAIGFFSPHNEAVFSVAIRTAVLDHDHLTMGVGSGLVADSDAAAEYEECLLKANFLRDHNFGLIETMRWQHNRCALLALHLDRLEASAAHFHFRFDRATIEQAIQTHAAPLDANTAWKLRLVLDAHGLCTFSQPEPIPHDETPLHASFWPTSIDSTSTLLRHKTTHRAFYNNAFAQAIQQGFIDVLFTNEHGNVTEGAIHNLFVRHGNLWRTPPLSAGVLPGVYRRHLLATNPHIAEANIPIADLQTADEIRLTNAVRGIRKIALHPTLLATN